MIYVINIGFGNISSVVKIINYLGIEVSVVSSPLNIKPGCKVILPGVGDFDSGVQELFRAGFDSSFWAQVASSRGFILGICLGMQLLCRGSEEGSESGLGLVDADVKKFCFPAARNLKVPHMGWNVVRAGSSNPLIPHTDEEQRFYFVHSYKVVPDDPNVVIGTANYGGEFCAAFQKRNIFGVQFHPEKSHRFGMALMKRFVEL